MWRVTETPGRVDGAEAFALFLYGAQLVLRSSFLTVLDLDEVDDTLKSVEKSLSRCCLKNVELLMAGDAVEALPFVSPICPLPLQSIHHGDPPPIVVCCFYVFVTILQILHTACTPADQTTIT